MLRIAVKTQQLLHSSAGRFAGRRARRGLTLVEYVLGAAMVVAVMFILRTQLTGVANTVMQNVRAGVS